MYIRSSNDILREEVCSVEVIHPLVYMCEKVYIGFQVMWF